MSKITKSDFSEFTSKDPFFVIWIISPLFLGRLPTKFFLRITGDLFFLKKAIWVALVAGTKCIPQKINYFKDDKQQFDESSLK